MDKSKDWYDGLVNYGDNLELEINQEETLATEVLVFMLVGLTGKI